jgi:glycerol-3-phosphate acyltransferase PlsY
MSALLIWRHKDNIKRLVAGQESRIGSKKKPRRLTRAGARRY